ncbi:MAG: TIM barrel protein [Acidobacteria bacterium]|nr:TIM barrel protein [Acidobacteriota bacterium]
MQAATLTRRTFLATATAAAASASFAAPAAKGKLRVGCQTNGWVMKPPSFDELIRVLGEARQMDYHGFECNNRFVRDQFNNTAEARKRIAATGMDFIGVHTSTGELDKAGFLDALVQGASKLGAHYVVLSSSGLAPDGKFTDDALRAKVAKLEEYGKVCNKGGMRLAYHNHQPEFANNNAEMNGIAERSNPELVSFLMDAGHGYQGGGDPSKFMLKHSHRIVGVHLKTFKNHTEQVPLGEGDFGFEALAAAIHRTGWSGWLIDEEGNPKRGDTAAVGPDRAYIRKIFGV